MTFIGIEKTGALFQSDNDKPGTCVVLMYHDVSKENYNRFVRQMQEMIRLAKPVATDSINDLENGRHHVAVTFDDGFASTIELVMPVLSDNMIPATFFIPSAHLGRGPEWIADMQRKKQVGPIISADNLKLLARDDYITIGSHGVHHRRLTEITDKDARDELIGSKKMLENITGNEVKMHGFPFGAYDDRHVAMAHEAGYGRVFTIDPTVVIGDGEKFVVGRVEVDPSDWRLEFILKVLGAYRWLPFASRLKERLSLMHSQ